MANAAPTEVVGAAMRQVVKSSEEVEVANVELMKAAGVTMSGAHLFHPGYDSVMMQTSIRTSSEVTMSFRARRLDETSLLFLLTKKSTEN